METERIEYDNTVKIIIQQIIKLFLYFGFRAVLRGGRGKFNVIKHLWNLNDIKNDNTICVTWGGEECLELLKFSFYVFNW